MALTGIVGLMFLLLGVVPQRLVARGLKVRGPVRPLFPFMEDVSIGHQLLIRGSGLLLGLAMVMMAGLVQFSSDCRYSARVEVIDGLAAAEAGLKSGDVVTAVEGARVNDFGAMKREAALVGRARATFMVLRDGHEFPVSLKVGGLLGLKPLDAPGVCEHEPVVEALTFPFAFLAAFISLVPLRETPSLVMWTSALSAGWWLAVLLELVALGINRLTRA